MAYRTHSANGEHLRLSAAENFKAKGNVRAANTVLKDVKRETLNQPQRVRFERMQLNQAILEPGNNAEPGNAGITPGNNVVVPAKNVVVPNNNVNLQNMQNALPADNE